MYSCPVPSTGEQTTMGRCASRAKATPSWATRYRPAAWAASCRVAKEASMHAQTRATRLLLLVSSADVRYAPVIACLRQHRTELLTQRPTIFMPLHCILQ